MFNFDNENAKYIEVVNHYLGMNHRTESFDLTKTDDLKQAFELAVGAYRDYSHYEGTLGELDEHFDESLEHYDTASWISMGIAPGRADSLAMKCAASLAEAYDNFCKISDKAREYLSVLLKIILTAPDSVQREILGNAFEISPGEINERLDDLYEDLTYIPYQYAIPDSLKDFLELLNKEWSELALQQ